MGKGWLLIGAFSGFVAVALGAFAAHGLKHVVSKELIDIFNLAVDYQFYHTFAIITVAFAGHWINSSLLHWAARSFLAGMILFSGSLYLYVLLFSKLPLCFLLVH